MHHPARTIRGIAEDLPEARPFLEKRDQQRHDLIRAVGRRAFAELGPGSFSIKDFAKAVWMSVTRFTHYYCDLESLLADLIETHLMDLYAAIGNIPSNTPDRPAAHRAAYFAATRTHRGGLTQSHLLLLHARRSLPPDLREPLEKLRDSLGEVMAPATPRPPSASSTPPISPPPKSRPCSPPASPPARQAAKPSTPSCNSPSTSPTRTRKPKPRTNQP